MASRQIVVIGLGRFGTRAARTLYQLGHDVMAIDLDDRKVQALTGVVTHAVQADATDEVMLKELGVDNFHYAIVAIGRNTEASILVTVLLRDLEIPVIVSRAQSELHGETLKRIGASKTVFPEKDGGASLAHDLFLPGVEQYLELTSSFGISRVLVPIKYVGHSLKDSGFSNARDKYGVVILAIQRRDDVILNPDEDELFVDDDVLLIAGTDYRVVRVIGTQSLENEI